MTQPLSKTALFVNKQKGGMFAVEDQSISTGNRWFVDSGKTTVGGDTAGFGRNPEAPFLTLDFAETQVTENNGDIIYLMPGHAESLTAPITLTKDGVTIIGLGKGDDRPTFTAITNTTATITMIAANDTSISGCRFICNIASQTEAIDIASDDVEIAFCEFREGSATGLAFITADTLDGDSDNLWIHDNTFTAPTAGNYDEAIQIGKDMRGVRIERNTIYGDFNEACIEVPVGGNACTELQIHWNRLSNLLTGQHCIQINGTAVTGMGSFNMCQTDTQATTIDGSALTWFQNFWLDVDGTNDEEAIPVNAPIAGTLAAGNDAVPTADTTDNVLTRDVVGNKTDAAAAGAVSTVESIIAYAKQVVTELIVVDGLHDVPTADVATNSQMRDVAGNKTDAAASGAVSAVESIMAYAKQLVTELIVVDGLHDVPTADIADNAQLRDVVGNKTDAAAAGAVSAVESIMAYAKQVVTELIVVDGLHDVPTADVATNDQMRDVVGNKTDAAAAGAVSAVETLMAYAKQNVTNSEATLVNTGTTLPTAVGEQVSKNVAFDGSGGNGAIGTVSLFTVTGAVKISIIATCSETVAGAGTLECGVSGSTAGIIAQIADATTLAVGEVWFDATPTTTLEAASNAELSFVLGDGQDIFLTIGGANLTDGTVDFNIVWTPLNAAGDLVAA